MKKRAETSYVNIVLFMIGIIWLLISVIVMLIPDFFKGESVLKILSTETLVFFIVIMINMSKTKKGIFHISIFFVLMLFLFLQGQLILNVFGIIKGGVLSNKFSDLELINGILQIHIFMAIFIIAISINQNKRYKKKCLNAQIADDNTALMVGYIIMLCALPFELYVNITKLTFTMTSGYASLYQDIALSSIPSSAKILSYFFMPGCFYMFFASSSGSIHERISLVLLLSHMMLELLIGYRAMAIVPMLLIIYGLSEKSKYVNVKNNKKIKKRIKLLCCIVLLLVVVIFPVVRATRNSGGIGNVSFGEIFSADNNEVFATINDMGKSMQTVIYTQRLVPEEYPFRYGITYLVNLTEAIPNLFWSRHPAEVYGSLGRWLTKIVDREFYEFGGALGYSCVAESYINFGWIGVVCFAYILGTIIARVENYIEDSQDATLYASWVIVANYLLMYPRGELSTIARGFFWYMLIPLIFVRMIKRSCRKNVYSSCSDKKSVR